MEEEENRKKKLLPFNQIKSLGPGIKLVLVYKQL